MRAVLWLCILSAVESTEPLQDTWEKEGGVELVYRLLSPPRAECSTRAVEVLKRRLDRSGFKQVHVDPLEGERIRVRIGGIKADELKKIKELSRFIGKLELRAVASKEIHEKWREDTNAAVPEGFQLMVHEESVGGDYAYIGEKGVLVAKTPIVTEREIALAAPQQSEFDRWAVAFELTEDGARRFDEAAQELFQQNPRGMIAIILDGRIQSMPIVQSERFGGKGQITGSFDKAAATDLALVLRSGALPCPIGSLDDKGNPVPGVPESERYVGPSGK